MKPIDPKYLTRGIDSPIEPFGRELIASGDLDPLYVVLVHANLEPSLLQRFLFAYWCFYNSGVAAHLADAPDAYHYWELFAEAAANATSAPIGGRWPRGHERRHFRGDNANIAVKKYRAAWPGGPEVLIDKWVRLRYNNAPIPFRRLREDILKVPQFGPWMAFKIGDMFERVLGIPVSFDNSDVFVFDSPADAAHLVAAIHEVRNVDPVRYAVAHLIAEYRDMIAPPLGDRPVALQEVETVLCKWKSSLSGHYPMGLDTHELKEGLDAWAPYSETAAKLAVAADHLPLNKFAAFSSEVL
jgi:hypothetical protein